MHARKLRFLFSLLTPVNLVKVIKKKILLTKMCKVCELFIKTFVCISIFRANTVSLSLLNLCVKC